MCVRHRGRAYRQGTGRAAREYDRPTQGRQAATQADLPYSSIASLVGVVLVLVFFITSWDSGTLVLDALAAGGKMETHKAQSIFWVVVVGATAVALLLGGGLRSLQSGSVVTGLPFMLVIALLCVGILRGLKRALTLQRAARGPTGCIHREPEHRASRTCDPRCW
jgi:BCCT family betaine/carnitine transporter